MKPKPYFEFKEFKIWHDQAALKVCTESCVLGAYTHVMGAKHILDIGTGNGILALMMAQRTPKAVIDAVEIDKNNYEQAKYNFSQSPFYGRINILMTDILLFQTDKKYDVIVSNPPFFENYLKSKDEQRNRAIHTDSLSFDDLITTTIRLLTEVGTFVIMLPEAQMRIFEQKAITHSLFPRSKFIIRNQPEKPIFRVIATFGQQPTTEPTETEFVIYEKHKSYTDQYRSLLKGFYLHF